MRRPAQTLVLVAAVAVLAGCGDKAAERESPTAQRSAPTGPTGPSAPGNQATPPGRPAPKPDPVRKQLLELLVPKGVPTSANGRPADVAQLAVVKRWLAAITAGDVAGAAAAFSDGALVQNLRPPIRLRNRTEREAFVGGFPCGAEIVDASSVRGYLVVTYRLTDRKDVKCDGPGGSAAGTIKVEDGRITEWYRLPDPPDEGPDEEPGPVV